MSVSVSPVALATAQQRPTPPTRSTGALRPGAAAAGAAQRRADVTTAAAADPAPCAFDATRRQLLGGSAAAALAALAGCIVEGGRWAVPPQAEALELAPLGRLERVGGDKLVGLSPQEVADILARNLREGEYLISGDLTPEIFADDCRFKDPTNETVGLSRYLKALGLLFDVSYSAVQLVDIRVASPTTIEADWRLGGYLRFPWHPRVEPFLGHTVYRLNEQGLVAEQDQSWSITGATALVESFTPTPGFSTDIKEGMKSA